MRQVTLLAGTTSWATWSQDRVYRYGLWRMWDPGRPMCNFLMLNPSTADETADDPTVARAGRYARVWGYGGLVVTNLFGYRATDPAAMLAAEDPIGPDNDRWIRNVADDAALLVAAWGAHGAHRQRSTQVRDLLCGKQMHCLHVTKSGEPGHPLYLRQDLVPRPFGRN